MKKKELEIILQSLSKYDNPKAWLEQYVTPANVAADILFLAYYLGDVENKIVADLGAGTGIFSIGACLLNARKVIAVEIDDDAIRVMRENLDHLKCKNVEIRNASVDEFGEKVDTVFQNPPFGSQRKHADLPFLKKAMEMGKIIYTLHNALTEDFLTRKIREMGGEITHIIHYNFLIPHIYDFHRKEKVKRKFVLFRIVKKSKKIKSTKFIPLYGND